jgi:tRNA wybutosine-synthesizing protein 1
MTHVDEYAKLVAKADPTYVEVKAYMHVGFSGLRLGFNNMPSHEEILAFAKILSDDSGYKILDESPESRVVLLSKRKKPVRFGSG